MCVEPFSQSERCANWLWAGLFSIPCFSTTPPTLLVLISPQTSPSPFDSVPASPQTSFLTSYRLQERCFHLQVSIQSLSLSLSLVTDVLVFHTDPTSFRFPHLPDFQVVNCNFAGKTTVMIQDRWVQKLSVRKSPVLQSCLAAPAPLYLMMFNLIIFRSHFCCRTFAFMK